MPSPTDSQNFIRITVEDANSEHVESLLRRQMSLRGERGITSIKKRRWYLQSWFILMVAAGAMAFTAWALMEPHFMDVSYLQGPIAAMDLDEPMVANYTLNNQQMHLKVPGQGWIQIGNQKIWLFEMTQSWKNGKAGPADFSELKVGQEARIYLTRVPADRDPPTLAMFVDPAPKPISPSRAAMTLDQQETEKSAVGLLLFPLVAGLVGVGVGAADGIICRMPRRALLCGAVGLLVGLLGGFVANILANLIYSPLNHIAMGHMAPGATRPPAMAFVLQMSGRGLAWLVAGTAMGLGQGIALRSKRLLLYGFLGGIVGGLVGGLLFDPIDFGIGGMNKPDAHLARMVGITVIGLCVGAMIGIVELLARDAWLRMTEGPLTGKEFLLFKDTMRIGSSSRSDIYLFNDPQVSPQHAVISTMGDQSEINSSAGEAMVLVNSRPTRRARLRHGDQITIGRTSFLFQSRKG